MIANVAITAADENEPAQEVLMNPELRAQKLWDMALDALDADDENRAVNIFLHIYENYSASDKAGEALWRAAIIKRDHALKTPVGDWEEIKDLFKNFTTDFPDSEHYREAYIEIGISYYRMKFYREALVYLNLFLDRFPDSSLAQQAHYWHGRTLIKNKKLDEAENEFRNLMKSAETEVRIMGLVGLGEVLLAKGKNNEALKVLIDVKENYPSYYIENPEFLIQLGMTYFRAGNEVKGAEPLFYYVNLVEKSYKRTEVIFELAESYFRRGDDHAAQKLYAKAIEDGAPEERAVVLSKFRQAQYLDDPQQKLTKWQRKGDLKDPQGDSEYGAVLDSYHTEPIAQDARYGLFLRYVAREDFDRAYDVGKSFLQHARTDKEGGRTPKATGEVLLYLVQELLSRGEFKKVYGLYLSEHAHVQTFPRGRLLYLVGQALQALNLYDQASVVYYRALALPLTDDEKIDLYSRRAEVYIANKDWASAARLLKYLRKIYKDTIEEGEIHYLSGRLSEEHEKIEEALGYYKTAVESPTFTDKKETYAEALLRILFELGQFEDAGAALETFADNWMDSKKSQIWFSKLGDEFKKQNKNNEAVEAYKAALNVEMSLENDIAQSVHLHLGEVYHELKKDKESMEHLQVAKSGKSELWSKLAAERIRYYSINKNVSQVKSILGSQ